MYAIVNPYPDFNGTTSPIEFRDDNGFYTYLYITSQVRYTILLFIVYITIPNEQVQR